MIEYILRKVVGTKNDRELKRYSFILEEVNKLESDMISLSDEQLRAKTP